MFRFKLMALTTIVVCAISLLSTRVVFANWYAWYSSGGEYYYGVWATIFTPSEPPNVAIGDHTSHSVTTPGGGPWIQAGWYHYRGESANKYYEYAVGGVHNIVPIGIQYWGTDIKYEVSQDGDPSLQKWCAWIGGVLQNCYEGIAPAPTIMSIQSEDHTNPQETVFYTTFHPINVRNSAGNWITPSLQNHLHSNYPYGVTQLSNDKFLTWRYGIFLPVIMK